MKQNCDKCPYNRFPGIPGSKPFKAKLAIVGEAPGNQEIGMKQPFVGPAGQLLNKALEAVGLPPREEIFVTNALLCRPPQQKPQLKTAIRECQARLLEELEQVQPEIILVLGNIAMHALTDDFDLKITQVMGRVITSPYFPNSKVIPVLHPAAVLRAPGDYKLFYSSLHYCRNIYDGGAPKDPGKTEWVPVEDEVSMQRMLKELSTKEVIAADIETTGLNPRRDELLVLGIAYDKNKTFAIAPNMLNQKLFELPIKWIWHNGKFDISFLRRRGFAAKVDHDTMLLSYCINEHGGIHDLGQISSRVLGAAPYKHKAKEKSGKKGFAALPKQDLYERVATDVDYTLQAFHELYDKVQNNKGLSNLYHTLMIPGSMFLYRVQRNGMFVDQDLLQEFKLEYQEHLSEIMDEILDMAQPLWDPEQYREQTGVKSAPEVFNPGSTYQVAWLLYDVLQLRPRGRKKGRSTDKEMLEKMQGQHPIIDKMLEYRSVSKELSTYIEGVERHIADDNRVHTTFKLHGTVTGRLSSSKPNVQNQPKRKPKIRNMYQAPPGKKLVEVDYKGAELRVLAHVSGDPVLRDCFIEGRDLHAEVAEALQTPRIRAKAVNFGIAYGRTEYSFAEEFEVSIEEARQYLEDWFARFPKAKEYMDKCARAVTEGRTLITPFGRHRRFGLITADNLNELQNEARNFVIQSVASDLTLLSAMEAEERLNEAGAKILNLVHDSILLEVDDNELAIHKTMTILGEVMSQVPIRELGTDVPFEVEFSVGYEWGNLKEVEVEEVAS